MTIYVENETDFTFPFDTKELCSRVAEAVLDAEGCPYETEINVLITDNEGIRLYNKEYRSEQTTPSRPASAVFLA